MSTILLAVFLAASAAPSGAVLSISGLPKTGALTISDLEGMAPVKAAWTNHGEKHEVYGVPLDRVLTRFGFEPGTMGKDMPVREKRKGWRLVVVASAPDGFQSVLTCAEVFESMGATRALVAWKVDGKPLPADRGPLRLIVVTDKEPSRSVHSVSKLEVVDPTAKAR